MGGSAITGKGLVLTLTDHNRLLKRIEVLARGLRDRLALPTLLLIGGDMGDLNLKELYLEATRHLGNSRTRPIYVVSAANPGKWFKPCHILEQAPRELFEVLSRVVPMPQPLIKPLASLPIKTEKKRSPYKYLDYFEPEDVDIFFGREEDWSHISREITASPCRVTVLCGRSGVGKTSLVKARLIPRLEQDKGIITTYTRFDNDPETSIFNALQTHIIKEGIKEKITDGDIKSARRILFQTGPVPGTFDKCMFITRINVRIGQRGNCKTGGNLWFKGGDTLGEEILNDLSPDRILPANLQIVCDRIYQESEGNALKLETYTKIGRAARTLKGHLEEAMSRLSVELESTARKVLQAMVTSEHTKDLLSLEQIVKRTQLPMKQVDSDLSEKSKELLRQYGGKFE
jgi:hypothetical protein